MKSALLTGKIQLAIDRLGSSHPLHSGILAQCRLDVDRSIQTTGIGWADGRPRLAYGPKFVAQLTLAELEGVLQHLVNHLLLGHMFHVPAPTEIRWARTLAEELTANEPIDGPLPGSALRVEDYPRLPRQESTAARYKRLFKLNLKTVGVQDTPLAALRARSAKWRVPNPSPDITTLDDHRTWEEFRARAAEQEWRLPSHIACAWEALTKQQQDKESVQFREIARMACGLEPGEDPGSETSRLAKDTGHLPWQMLLRRRVGRQLERRPKFSRPPRRFPELAGLVPSWGRSGAKPTILAAIDTSGSLTNEMLSEISAELAMMAQSFHVTVAECDTRIHAVYPYRPITEVHGRGGTDLRPPLEWEFLRRNKADLVVYFTDGIGPAPDKSPRIPVIWCLTEAGVKPAAWGAEIKLQGAETRP